MTLTVTQSQGDKMFRRIEKVPAWTIFVANAIVWSAVLALNVSGALT